MRHSERRWIDLVRRVVLAALASCHAGAVSDDAAADADTGEACAAEPTPWLDDAGPDCAWSVALPCGLPDSSMPPYQCYPDLATCASVCGTTSLFYCVVAPASCVDGDVLPAPTDVECVSCAGGGRRPRGLVPLAPEGTSALGRHFAAAAYVEAASIRAFEDVARALVRFGAPRRLVVAARRAARDEARHARAMTRVARRFGGRPRRVEVAPAPEVELPAWLLDNAVEGCAREAFGAVVAAWQAERAPDAGLRAAMRGIARDEACHAALAWAIFAWGVPHLQPVVLARVRAALSDAVLALRDAPLATSAAARRGAGLPSPREQRVLGSAFAEAVRHELQSCGEDAHPSRRPAEAVCLCHATQAPSRRRARRGARHRRKPPLVQ